MKRTFRPLAVALVLGFGSILSAQSALLSVSPGLGFPLAPADLYTLEAGASLDLRLASPSGALEGLGRIGYSNLVIDQGLGGISIVKLEGGLALPLLRTPSFSLGPTLLLGGYGAFRSGTSALFNPMAEAGIRAEAKIGGIRLALEPGGEFLLAMHDGQPGAFLASAGVRLSISFTPGSSGGSHKPLLQIQDPALDPFFPIIYKTYATKALGSATITNQEKQPIKDVEVTFFAPSYMDGAQIVASFPELKPGESKEIKLTALLKNSVLGITETDSAQARLQVSYTLGRESLKVGWEGSLRIEGRNAIIWNDDKEAAAFVTAKDPTILKFSRNMASSLPSGGAAIPSENLRSGALIFQALEAYGLRYVVDPKGSYATMKGVKSAVDYLQFPVETLAYRTGDCDDLSTLYNAMLEALGIETAYITIPGHIYSAFALELPPASLASILSDPTSYIMLGGKAWIPVEATALGKGFQAAWALGASQWSENSRSMAANLIPVHEAWKSYEPSFISSAERPDVVGRLPEPAKVVEAYSASMKKLADREVTAILAKLGAGNGSAAALAKLSPQVRNRVGAVYARYGSLDKAEATFKDLVGLSYGPGVYNLANIRFLKKDYVGATELYRKATALLPGNAEASLGLAKALFESGKQAEANLAWQAAAKLAPDKAAAYAYIGGAAGAGTDTARAADPSVRQAVAWND